MIPFFLLAGSCEIIQFPVAALREEEAGAEAALCKLGMAFSQFFQVNRDIAASATFFQESTSCEQSCDPPHSIQLLVVLLAPALLLLLQDTADEEIAWAGCMLLPADQYVHLSQPADVSVTLPAQLDPAMVGCTAAAGDGTYTGRFGSPALACFHAQFLHYLHQMEPPGPALEQVWLQVGCHRTDLLWFGFEAQMLDSSRRPARPACNSVMAGRHPHTQTGCMIL